MANISYDFYSCDYGGVLIPREAFEGIVRYAEGILDNILRVKWQETQEKGQVLCEICELIYQEEERRGIRRESLDGYDVTYSDSRTEEKILRLVRRRFGSSGVLYRGRPR